MRQSIRGDSPADNITDRAGDRCPADDGVASVLGSVNCQSTRRRRPGTRCISEDAQVGDRQSLSGYVTVLVTNEAGRNGRRELEVSVRAIGPVGIGRAQGGPSL